MRKFLSKEMLSLAGEYMVASEICRRGAYAQLTLGNRKCTDILVDTDNAVVRIEVKTTQRGEWPAIRGLHRGDDAIVLVDFTKKSLNETPSFYILDIDDWKQLLADEKERCPNIAVDSEFLITYPDGWRGLNLKPTRVLAFKDKWEKIVKTSTAYGEAT